jgi:DNA-directed RNA polymerase subunit RPC12/RpoP
MQQKREREDGEDGHHFKCVLCNKEFAGWGNNAGPLAEGLCCDNCNYRVMMARLSGADVIVENTKENQDEEETMEETTEDTKEETTEDTKE